MIKDAEKMEVMDPLETAELNDVQVRIGPSVSPVSHFPGENARVQRSPLSATNHFTIS